MRPTLPLGRTLSHTKLILSRALQILRFRGKHLSRLRFSWSLFSQCGNEDKSFLVKGKALGVEGSRSNRWSRYPRNPWRKVAFIPPFSYFVSTLAIFFVFLPPSLPPSSPISVDRKGDSLSFSLSLSLSLYYIDLPGVYFSVVVERYGDLPVLRDVVSNVFWNWKPIGKNNSDESGNKYKSKALAPLEFSRVVTCGVCIRVDGYLPRVNDSFREFVLPRKTGR